MNEKTLAFYTEDKSNEPWQIYGFEQCFLPLFALKYQLQTISKIDKLYEQNNTIINQNNQIIELLQKIANK